MRTRKLPTKEKPYVTFATALNYFDPDQRQMIEHIQQRTNFSDYFKRLVLLDMDGASTHYVSEYKKSSDEDEILFNEGFAKGLL